MRHYGSNTKKVLTIVSLLLVIAGLGWLLAEWLSNEIALRSPCPGAGPCDIVIGYEGKGIFLVAAGGILMLCNIVIHAAKAAVN